MGKKKTQPDTGELVIKLPEKGDKGYLRRSLEWQRIQEQAKVDELNEGEVQADTFERLIDFFAQFVQGFDTHEEKKNALLDLSEEGWDQLTEAYGSEEEDAGDDPAPKAKSGD